MTANNKEEKCYKINETIKNEFQFSECIGDRCVRYGTIFFSNGTFTKCEFGGLKTPYTQEDWSFLGKLSEFIATKIKNLNRR